MNDFIALYSEYVKTAARYYLFSVVRGRMAYDDLLQEGYLTLIRLWKQGHTDAPFVKKSICNHFLQCVTRNCSPLHMTRYAAHGKWMRRAALRAKL